MKKTLYLFLTFMVLLILVGCLGNNTVAYNIEGPSHLEFDELSLNIDSSVIKSEIEEQYQLVDSNQTIIHDYQLQFDYNDFSFGTSGSYQLYITVDNEDLEVTLKAVSITLTYIEDVDPTEIYFSITIYLNISLEETPYDVIELEEGELILDNLPEVTRDDYLFDYWSLDDEGLFKINNLRPIDEDINVYANWERISLVSSIDIFYINDLHGRIFHDPNNNILGISNMYQFIKQYENENDIDSVLIFGGDIFQGTLISSFSRGSVLIEIMNAMNADALVLGNHEFDWGIEEILKYFDDSNYPIKANFPLLGTNAVRKDNGHSLPGVNPYALLNIGNLNVGIVGTIDQGLETSIMEYKVSDYTFLNPVTHTETYTQLLRNEYNANIVIASIHGGEYGTSNYYFNQQIRNLSGDSLVDVSLNAHSHARYEGTLNRSHAYDLIAMQSGAYGSNLGHITLELSESGEITNHTINQYSAYDSRFTNSNSEIDTIINDYFLDVEEAYTDPLIQVNSRLSVSQLANYIARISREYTDSDVGIQNSGGTRSTIEAGSMTHADIYEVFSFDNLVIEVEVLGSQLKSYINRFSNSVSYRPGLTINDINDNEYYKVAVNEYIYAFTSNPFLNGINQVFHGSQDLIMKETVTKLRSLGYEVFNINHPNVWEDDLLSYNYYPYFIDNYLYQQ